MKNNQITTEENNNENTSFKKEEFELMKECLTKFIKNKIKSINYEQVESFIEDNKEKIFIKSIDYSNFAEVMLFLTEAKSYISIQQSILSTFVKRLEEEIDLLKNYLSKLIKIKDKKESEILAKVQLKEYYDILYDYEEKYKYIQSIEKSLETAISTVSRILTYWQEEFGGIKKQECLRVVKNIE